jgi:hypothetical protein
MNLSVAASLSGPLASLGMAGRHAGLVRIEMRTVLRCAMTPFDVDQRKLRGESRRAACAIEQTPHSLRRGVLRVLAMEWRASHELIAPLFRVDEARPHR